MAGLPDWMKSPLSTSAEPVRVQIGVWPMAIPKAYLDAPIERDGDRPAEEGFIPTTGVFMVMELLEMTPRTETSMREWLKHRGWTESRWVSVLLKRSDVGIAGPSDTVFRIFSGINRKGAEVREEGAKHGIDRLAVDRARQENFVRFENGERTVFIVCHMDGMWCRQFLRIRPALQAEVSYGRQYLPRWQEIERKARAAIDGFIEEAAENKPE